MSVSLPHYLLISEAELGSPSGGASSIDVAGRWRFVLEATDGSSALEAVDEDDTDDSERLELLAVVRGLEALDQPSRVTLVTSSRYVCQGLRFGLEEWRETDWQWERFGEMVPIKNADLWRRVDTALKYHSVDCRTWRIDRAHSGLTGGRSVSRGAPRGTRRRERTRRIVVRDTRSRPDESAD